MDNEQKIENLADEVVEILEPSEEKYIPMDSQPYITISEAAKLLGMSISSVRQYTDTFLEYLPDVKITDNNVRLYSMNGIQKLKEIYKIMKRYNYSKPQMLEILKKESETPLYERDNVNDASSSETSTELGFKLEIVKLEQAFDNVANICNDLNKKLEEKMEIEKKQQYTIDTLSTTQKELMNVIEAQSERIEAMNKLLIETNNKIEENSNKSGFWKLFKK